MFNNQAIQPKFLYHASQNRNIKILKPRAKSIRSSDEGPVVFASPDKAYASMFLVPSDDCWTSKGQFDGWYYQAISEEERYRKLDKGGAIYTFKSNTFKSDPTRGMREKEWISKEPVKPVKKEIYESGLDAMMQLGVKVVFISPAVFSRFRQMLRRGLIKEAFKLIFSPDLTSNLL
ncbi:MAG TPA: hypothetical protein VMW41_02060 [Candidatus Bathyarchaeia archaeon]|nr:hypothetical protein [Candidatus Bathyarchaeia archaeon]